MKYIKMNIDYGIYKKYQEWPFDKAPKIVKRWAINKDIAYIHQVCTIIEKEEDEESSDSVAPEAKTNVPEKQGANKCKGIKADGSPCGNDASVNGYCRWHQDQADPRDS